MGILLKRYDIIVEKLMFFNLQKPGKRSIVQFIICFILRMMWKSLMYFLSLPFNSISIKALAMKIGTLSK